MKDAKKSILPMISSKDTTATGQKMILDVNSKKKDVEEISFCEIVKHFIIFLFLIAGYVFLCWASYYYYGHINGHQQGHREGYDHYKA